MPNGKLCGLFYEWFGRKKKERNMMVGNPSGEIQV
jgi:hypothetical protein